MHKSDTWLAPTLERELGRVAAPDELWDRIHWPRAQTSARSNPKWLSVALVTGLAILITALSYRPALSIRSGRPAEIRSWVKTNTGLDIPLRPEASSSAVLERAQCIRGADPSAEIAFRIENRPGILRVSKRISEIGSTAAGPSQHGIPSNNASVASWATSGQVFTLACSTPEDLKTACLLCHT